jgi:hypothetical protein
VDYVLGTVVERPALSGQAPQLNNASLLPDTQVDGFERALRE